MPFVTFDFGETERSIPGDGALELVELLNKRTTETGDTEHHQLALNIEARATGAASTSIPMAARENRELLWPVVDGYRDPEARPWLEPLWVALNSAGLP